MLRLERCDKICGDLPMLHEQNVASEVVRQVSVNEAEYAKFSYLIKVCDAVDRAHNIAKEFLRELKADEGLRGYMDFDWRSVDQFVQPQLRLTFLQEASRDPVQQAFMRFPHAAIVVRNAQVIELDTVFELNLEGSDLHPEVDEVTNAFRILEAKVRSLEGRRAVDAEKSVNQLRRVLRLEL